MIKRLEAIIFISLFFTVVFSQEQKDTLDLDLFQGLISVVTNQKDSLVKENLNYVSFDVRDKNKRRGVPKDLMELVEEFYKTPKNEHHEIDVLNYLSNVYVDHNYYESGNWAPNSNFVSTYVPFKGELPEYQTEDFQLPVSGKLTSVYGYRPKFKRFHRGIDVSLNIGDTVKCVLPGIVTKTGYEPGGYGRYVVVSHAGGIETLYGHLLESRVLPGQKMIAGDAVGLGGTTGNATGAHLHFETRYRGIAIDPITWFDLTGRLELFR